MFQMINTIVEKGDAERVIDAAVAAGSPGGTILNARGSGIHETSRLFGLEVEPEKEMVIVVAPREDVQGIVAAIYDALELGEPGNGIIFIQDVARVRGLYQPEPANG